MSTVKLIKIKGTYKDFGHIIIIVMMHIKWALHPLKSCKTTMEVEYVKEVGRK